VQAEEITASPASQASRNHCKGLCAGRRNNCSGLCAGFKKSLQRPGAQAEEITAAAWCAGCKK
jgi:hypothetical protein